MKKLLIAFITLLLFANCLIAQDAWNLQTYRITSKWAEEINPEAVLQEYPRPQMVRGQWLNLNGLWDYAIVEKDTEKPAGFDVKINQK